MELTFEEEDLAAPKVRGVTPKRIVPAGRLQGQITFDGATPTPEYKQLGTIVEKLTGGPHPLPRGCTVVGSHLLRACRRWRKIRCNVARSSCATF